MTWKPPLLDGLDPNRYTVVTYDLGYRILPNGDIVTSDGKPRNVCEVQMAMVAAEAAKDGREITFQFRAPTPEELEEWA